MNELQLANTYAAWHIAGANPTKVLLDGNKIFVLLCTADVNTEHANTTNGKS